MLVTYLDRDEHEIVDGLEHVQDSHGVRGHVVGDLPHGHLPSGRGEGGETKSFLVHHGLDAKRKV